MNKIDIKVGNTPLIELKNIEEYYHLPFRLFAKDESHNPTGSIKDRAALSIIQSALDSGEIKEGDTIVEATSGNMGISLAYIAKLYHLSCRIYMPSSASKERKEMMENYGAEVIIVNGAMKDCVEEAINYSKDNPHAYYTDQFVNRNNPLAHILTTSKEIISSLNKTPDYFFAGVGTGGTLIGTSKGLKEKDNHTKIIGIEPASSPLLTEGRSGAHKIQGIGANFVPSIYQKEYVDEVITVSNEEAYLGAKLLKEKENLFNGISSGAALMGAIKYRDKIKENSDVVIILPDSGNRYLSVEGLYE